LSPSRNATATRIASSSKRRHYYYYNLRGEGHIHQFILHKLTDTFNNYIVHMLLNSIDV